MLPYLTGSEIFLYRKFCIAYLRRGTDLGQVNYVGPRLPVTCQARFYYTQTPGYPPPPPPPFPPSARPHGKTEWFHNYAAPPGFYPPNSPFSSGLGTMERPIVVTSAPQKPNVWRRLWWSFISVVGVIFLFSLFDNSELFHDNIDASKVGGMSRASLQSMYGGNEIKPVNLDSLDTTFSDVRGCDEAKKELEDIVEFLKDPERFHKLGSRLPKGALLVGPPGCGKTLLAKAIAKEAGVSFFYASGSEFDEMFVGVGSRRVRELFAAAKASAPALIFIDEIDALGGKRSRTDHAYSRMTLNQLLAEMDGFQSNESVIVFGATNTPQTLDKALTRPGRFDTIIAVDPPDTKGRAELVQLYLNQIKAESSLNAMEIARVITGFTGAEIRNLINMAAIRAAVLRKNIVTRDEIEYAKDRILMGAESKKAIPEKERRITAYHEGGHALVALLLKDEGADPIHKATIVPRGNGVMGLVHYMPQGDKYSRSRREYLASLKVCVGGRVGEEMLLGVDDITNGSGSDFNKASSIARQMVRRFGFSDKLGCVDYESSDTAEGAYMSDETKLRIENEVQKLVDDSYTEVKKLLENHRGELENIANHLLKHETLSGAELERILKGESIPERVPLPTPVTTSSENPPQGSPKGRRPKVVPIS